MKKWLSVKNQWTQSIFNCNRIFPKVLNSKSRFYYFFILFYLFCRSWCPRNEGFRRNFKLYIYKGFCQKFFLYFPFFLVPFIFADFFFLWKIHVLFIFFLFSNEWCWIELRSKINWERKLNFWKGKESFLLIFVVIFRYFVLELDSFLDDLSDCPFPLVRHFYET